MVQDFRAPTLRPRLSGSAARCVGVAPLLVVLTVIGAASGCSGGKVVRVVDDVEVPGRFISDVAYAAYARGAEHEARGQYAEGLAAYAQAAASDPGSVEAWTRVGALQCRLDREDEAGVAFAEARDIDEDYEPLWRARALCAERRGDRSAALVAAKRAVGLDPERDETVLLYVRLLDADGQTEPAGRWLRALAILSPSKLPVWEALEAQARRGQDELWTRHAATQVRRLRERLGQRRPVASDRSPWQLVDDALLAGDIVAARRYVRQARLDPRLLPARAIVLGHTALAAAEAEVRIDAEPADTDTRLALALAADLLGQGDRTSRRMGTLPATVAPLTEVGRLMLGELLLRHLGPAAAAQWLGRPISAGVEGVNELRQRLREALQPLGGNR